MNDRHRSQNKAVSLKEWLVCNDRGWRILRWRVLCFLPGLFLHFREVRLDVLELNTSANRYIVAQTDFEFPDYESTIILKQQAMQDVGQIFQLDPKQCAMSAMSWKIR